MKTTIKNASLNTLLIITSFMFSFILCEIIIRFALPEKTHEYFVEPTRTKAKFYRFDPKLGWTNAPGMYGTYKTDEFSYSLKINNHGMRQEEITTEPSEHIFRIALMGDSNLWSVGVSNPERFTDIIGEDSSIETLNFGVPGYGPIHYLVQLNDIIKFKPDIIIIGFTLSNDFTDNIRSPRYGVYKPYATINASGNLEIKGYPLKNVKMWGNRNIINTTIPILRSSLFINKLAQLYREQFSVSEQQGLTSFSRDILYLPKNKLLQHEIASISKAVDINKKIFEEIRNKLEKHNIPLVVVTFPTKCEYNPECHYGHNKVNSRSVQRLIKTMEELNIDLINTVPILNGNDFREHDNNVHWNPTGHKKMVPPILNYLKEKKYISN